jgi:hypothetical protein
MSLCNIKVMARDDYRRWRRGEGWQSSALFMGNRLKIYSFSLRKLASHHRQRVAEGKFTIVPNLLMNFSRGLTQKEVERQLKGNFVIAFVSCASSNICCRRGVGWINVNHLRNHVWCDVARVWQQMTVNSSTFTFRLNLTLFISRWVAFTLSRVGGAVTKARCEASRRLSDFSSMRRDQFSTRSCGLDLSSAVLVIKARSDFSKKHWMSQLLCQTPSCEQNFHKTPHEAPGNSSQERAFEDC